MTLLVAKGFSQEDFANLHPGGKLGKRLMRVEQLMHGGEDTPIVGSDTPMLAAVDRSAAVQPLTLLLDDVHRADEATLDLLAFVADQLRDTRIVLVATSRTEQVELAGVAAATLTALPAWMLRVDLTGLDLNATADLVHGLTPNASAEVVAHIHRRTAGNPFFVSEVARLYATRERQGVDDGHDVPTAVQHVLSRRFARLDQDAVQHARGRSRPWQARRPDAGHSHGLE